MQTKRKAFGWQRRLWAMALAAVLACIPMVGTATAAPSTSGVIVPDEPAPKPTVSIVGNVVVDKNKPTGFYELSLRVKTPRIITPKAGGDPLTEEEYAQVLEEDELNDTHKATEDYDIKNYPFESVAAAVYINLDALWPVTWGTGKPVYDTWNANNAAGTVGRYQAHDWADDRKAEDFPRGIDLKSEEQPKIFTDLSGIIGGNAVSVRLDTAHPDEITNATALIEKVNGTTALLTLTANTTTTSNVIYNSETPVVVVRFAYDMNRFTRLEVGNPAADEPNNSDFWVGLDKSDDDHGPRSDQFPLTYLAEGKDNDGGYATADGKAAASSSQQTLWYAQNLRDDNAGQTSTHFYYYLGADELARQDRQSYMVVDSDTQTVPTLDLIPPKTVGRAALAKKDTRPGYGTTDDPETEKYSFFQNLLQMGHGLILRMENAETYRKPTGSGGTTILFYDWDDSLIGSLVVDKGDVRAEVNEYVETNLIHPDLRASKLLRKGKVPEEGDANRDAYANLLDSLNRDYTYRGKYAYTVGDPDNVGPDGDTTNKARANGEDYPLTNKLDYVFYRRLNRIVEQTGENNTKTSYYSTTSLLDENNQDAALYPYVYGWAVVEDTTKTNNWKIMYDAAKTEDVWTTMGVGELSSVKPGVGRTNTPFPGTLTIEDVTEPAFIAYETAKLIKKGEVVAVPTQYQYTTASTASNKYFRFADFSNIDAELARYKKADGSNKDTLIVKAVYEPGESLMVDTSYRLVKEPYYNKMNALPSGAGATYSVEMVLERADTSMGSLRGVSRTRLPAIRQDTTADNKWLEDDRIPGHDAANADNATAIDKSQTSYVQAQMQDGDTVTYTLTLSARHNKIDSYLIEQYGLNYVIGGQRSDPNFNQVGTYKVSDNYNYYHVTDSNTADNYLDVQNYNEKEGSFGFVLMGTLNNIMEQATLCNRGEITTSQFAEYASEDNLIDANIRTASGALPAWDTASSLRTAIRNAAQACADDHYGDPAYWNIEKDCAQLNYHQLQRFITTGSLPTDETDDENPGAIISWCHLHKSCAASVSNKPKNWEQLIEKAKDNAVEDMMDLLLDELQTMTRLRANISGGEYTDRDLLVEHIVAAVQAGCESWNDIQYYLIHRAPPVTDAEKAEANARYWWYDGSSSNSAPTDLPALLTAVKASLEAPLNPPPDGDLTPRTAKLYGVKAIVDDNATQLGETVTNRWRNLTHNLVADADENGSPIRFTSYEQFIAALADAVTKRPTLTGADRNSWNTLQRLILEAAADPDEPSTTDYYWYDGARRITSLAGMIAAAQEYHAGDTALWDSLTQTMFTNFADPAKDPFWYFADAFEMTRFLDFTDETDYNNFLAIFLDWVADPLSNKGNNLNTTWGEIQYMIAHGGVLDVTGAINEMVGGFYWWKGGVTTPPDYDLSTVQGILDNAAMAAFSSKINGNAAAWDSLDQDALDVLNLRYLTDADAADWGFDNLTGTPKPNGNTTVDADHNTRDIMPRVTVEQFKAAMEGMVQSYLDAQVAAGNGHGHDLPPPMTVYEMQYGIINAGAYLSEGAMPQVTVGTYMESNGYWWLSTADAPNKWTPPKVEVPIPDDWNTFIGKLSSSDASITVTAADLALADVQLSYNSTKWAGVGRALATAKKRLALAVAGIEAEGGTAADLTWYQLQVALTDGGYQSSVAAYNLFKDADWVPEWVKQKWDPNYVAP